MDSSDKPELGNSVRDAGLSEYVINPIIRRQTLGDVLRRTALRTPLKTAIICGTSQWIYCELDALVSRLAAGLAQIGVRHADRVADTLAAC